MLSKQLNSDGQLDTSLAIKTTNYPSCKLFSGINRRHFVRLALVGIGFSLPSIMRSYKKEDRVEAGWFLPGLIAGVSLVNGLFDLYENVRGVVRVANRFLRSYSGHLKFEIYDLNSGRLEVSESMNCVAHSGFNDFQFSCTGCDTRGIKRLIIFTADNSMYVDFRVS